MRKFLIKLPLLIFCLLTLPLLAEEPWGKHTPFSKTLTQHSHENSQNPIVYLGIRAIKFHQRVISPADGPRSHFYPSSSQYTLEAMQEFGFWKGFMIGCDRLMRENSDPWIYTYIQISEYDTLKLDPIPYNSIQNQ